MRGAPVGLTAKVWPQRAQVPFVGLRGMGMSFGPRSSVAGEEMERSAEAMGCAALVNKSKRKSLWTATRLIGTRLLQMAALQD